MWNVEYVVVSTAPVPVLYLASRKVQGTVQGIQDDVEYKIY